MSTFGTVGANFTVSKYSRSQDTSGAYGRKRRRTQTNPNDWATSIPSQRERVLLLGMSYPDIREQLVEHCDSGRSGSTKSKFNKEQSAGVEMVVEMVKKKLLNEVDGRDLARILALEASDQYEAHAVSIQDGAEFSPEKYLHANFNKIGFVDKVCDKWIAPHASKTKEIRYSQIIMDYFWIPKGWAEQHWTAHLFKTNLPDFHKILKKDGAVYFPFKAHCFNKLVENLSTLSSLYDITFLKRWDLEEVILWRHTQDIDPEIMENVFRKKIDQEDLYCELDKQELNTQLEAVGDIFSWIDDVENIRFIKMTPVEARGGEEGGRGGEKKKKTSKKKKPLKGGFVHMRGKSGRRVAKNRTEKEEQELAIRCQAPPTYEMLTENDMSSVTQMCRFKAWWMSGENEKVTAYWNRRSLREPHVRLVNSPRWCHETASLLGLSKGPTQVISDPLGKDAYPKLFKDAFHPSKLCKEVRTNNPNPTAVLGACREALLKYGLKSYQKTPRTKWNKDFPELRSFPLWRIVHKIEEQVLGRRKAKPPDPEKVFEEIKEEKRLQDEGRREAAKRRETAKLLKAERERNKVELQRRERAAAAEEKRKMAEEKKMVAEAEVEENRKMAEAETEGKRLVEKEGAALLTLTLTLNESEAEALLALAKTSPSPPAKLKPTEPASPVPTAPVTQSSLPSPATSPAPSSSAEEEWALVQIYDHTSQTSKVPSDVLSAARVTRRSALEKCSNDNCETTAVAVWRDLALGQGSRSRPTATWRTCEPCQMKDFGGWPQYSPTERKATPKKVAKKVAKEAGHGMKQPPRALSPPLPSEGGYLPIPDLTRSRSNAFPTTKIISDKVDEFSLWLKSRKELWRKSYCANVDDEPTNEGERIPTKPEALKEPTKQEAPKEPNAPPSAKPAQKYFVMAKCAELKVLSPEISDKERSKKATELWKACTKEERRPFLEQAAADKERYKRELESHVSPANLPFKKRKNNAEKANSPAVPAVSNVITVVPPASEGDVGASSSSSSSSFYNTHPNSISLPLNLPNLPAVHPVLVSNLADVRSGYSSSDSIEEKKTVDGGVITPASVGSQANQSPQEPEPKLVAIVSTLSTDVESKSNTTAVSPTQQALLDARQILGDGCNEN
ncbi:hypothetical protein TrST_g10541 [Triparma strigata]|uniref:HMG box domain-containing protein n=1 Tax=Triparma strigata TaxID=1606541 RepID=A0A9W7EGN1_9STRA|nr:hypothetical protein TrST_g10541 [Triparma strigata]